MSKSNEMVQKHINISKDMNDWLIEYQESLGYDSLSATIRYILNQRRYNDMQKDEKITTIEEEKALIGKHVWLLFVPLSLFFIGLLANNNPLLINMGLGWIFPLAHFLGFLSLGAITLFFLHQLKRI